VQLRKNIKRFRTPPLDVTKHGNNFWPSNNQTNLVVAECGMIDTKRAWETTGVITKTRGVMGTHGWGLRRSMTGQSGVLGLKKGLVSALIDEKGSTTNGKKQKLRNDTKTWAKKAGPQGFRRVETHLWTLRGGGGSHLTRIASE